MTNDLNPYAGEAGTDLVEKPMQAIQSAQVAEVQAMATVAQAVPRDKLIATNRILNECSRIRLAKESAYSYKRGKAMVTGPSIRLAEVLAQNWGNCVHGWHELSRDNGQSQVVAYCWDMETNTRAERRFIVQHIRETKTGNYKLTDSRDIYELVANHASRRVRAAILAIIPGDVVEAAVKQCTRTQLEKIGDIDEAVDKIKHAFEGLGIDEERLAKFLGHSLRKVEPGEVLRLRQIYQGIKDGIYNASEWFGGIASGGASTADAELEKAAAAKKTRRKPAAKKEEPSPPPSEETKAANADFVAGLDREEARQKDEE